MSRTPNAAEILTVGDPGNFVSLAVAPAVKNLGTVTIRKKVTYFASQIQAHSQTSGQSATLQLINTVTLAVLLTLIVSDLGSYVIDNNGDPISVQIGPFDSDTILQLQLNTATGAILCSGLCLLRQANPNPPQTYPVSV